MNLAPLMGCINGKIPFADGYVSASAESIVKWRQRLERKPQHQLIALHWQVETLIMSTAFIHEDAPYHFENGLGFKVMISWNSFQYRKVRPVSN